MYRCPTSPNAGQAWMHAGTTIRPTWQQASDLPARRRAEATTSICTISNLCNKVMQAARQARYSLENMSSKTPCARVASPAQAVHVQLAAVHERAGRLGHALERRCGACIHRRTGRRGRAGLLACVAQTTVSDLKQKAWQKSKANVLAQHRATATPPLPQHRQAQCLLQGSAACCVCGRQAQGAG